MLKLETDGTITYKGQVVVKHVHKAGEDTVEIRLTYKTPPGDWITPLTYLAIGLQKIEPPPAPVALQVVTSEEDIEEQFDVPDLLIEKEIKRNGYIWEFHKSDPDPWPSPLHGHDYEKGLTIDAITGNIFVKATRQRRKTLKRKALAILHGELRNCKDLEALAAAHLPRA